MTKGLKIAFFLTLIVAFVACEKCDKPSQQEDPFATTTRGAGEEKEGYVGGMRGTGSELIEDPNGGSDGDITDPNEDEDFDGIVDPEEDEDFDKEGK